jgi:hypothetical protein
MSTKTATKKVPQIASQTSHGMGRILLTNPIKANMIAKKFGKKVPKSIGHTIQLTHFVTMSRRHDPESKTGSSLFL